MPEFELLQKNNQYFLEIRGVRFNIKRKMGLLLDQVLPEKHVLNNSPCRKYHKKQGGKCIYCQTKVDFCTNTLDQSNYATLEHLMPLSKMKGGSKKLVAMACYICNNKRGNMDFSKFIGTFPKQQRTKILRDICKYYGKETLGKLS